MGPQLYKLRFRQLTQIYLQKQNLYQEYEREHLKK